MKCRNYYLLLIVLLVGCNSNEFEDVNGTKATFENQQIISEDIKYYATEEEFLARFMDNNQTPAISWNDDLTRSSSSVVVHKVFGYDRIEYGSWSKVIYGNFITKYGLQPNQTYLERKAVCVKVFACASTDAIIERTYDSSVTDPIGYIPGTTIDNKYIRGYKLDSYVPSYGGREARSFVFHVGSDISGKVWNVYFPYQPETLVWYYKTVSDTGGWD